MGHLLIVRRMLRNGKPHEDAYPIEEDEYPRVLDDFQEHQRSGSHSAGCRYRGPGHEILITFEGVNGIDLVEVDEGSGPRRGFGSDEEDY
jgi:hypothetical protein